MDEKRKRLWFTGGAILAAVYAGSMLVPPTAVVLVAIGGGASLAWIAKQAKR